MADLNKHEREVLEMLGGVREWAPWGAWIGACLEHLHGCGYATPMPYQITPAGRAALSEAPRPRPTRPPPHHRARESNELDDTGTPVSIGYSGASSGPALALVAAALRALSQQDPT
jgi:hypothetical protein